MQAYSGWLTGAASGATASTTISRKHLSFLWFITCCLYSKLLFQDFFLFILLLMSCLFHVYGWIYDHTLVWISDFVCSLCFESWLCWIWYDDRNVYFMVFYLIKQKQLRYWVWLKNLQQNLQSTTWTFWLRLKGVFTDFFSKGDHMDWPHQGDMKSPIYFCTW